MILLDTSVLIDALTGRRRSENALRAALDRGERLALSAHVLYEWRRGPRIPQELALQEAFCPSESALAFGPAEAVRAAEIYRTIRSPRAREADIAIAASAMCADATLWTLNVRDFADIRGLRLAPPGG